MRIDECDEFVAGVADNDSEFADGAVQDFCHLYERLVARCASIVLVERLETVDVDQKSRYLEFFLLGVFPVQVVQVGVVEHAGQLVPVDAFALQGGEYARDRNGDT